MFVWFENIISHLVTHVMKLTRLVSRIKHHAESLGTWLASQEDAETPEFDEDHFRRWQVQIRRREGLLDERGYM